MRIAATWGEDPIGKTRQVWDRYGCMASTAAVSSGVVAW
jgi:hypothetical protein